MNTATTTTEPTTTVSITLELPAEWHNYLIEVASNENCSTADVIRSLIVEGMLGLNESEAA